MKTKYDKEKWMKVCNTTLSNYINMEKRLSENRRFSEFILIYYSLFFIINSLTAVYFDFYNDKLCEYFGLILSVVMLAYSFINSNANYTKRINNITNAINELKTLKRTSIIDEDIDEFVRKYNAIVDGVEFRSDIDFFRTVKAKCKEQGIRWYLPFDAGICEEKKQLKNYLSEISPFCLQMKNLFNLLFKAMVIILPIVVIILCFVI